MDREIVGLVEAAAVFTPRVQGYGHDATGIA